MQAVLILAHKNIDQVVELTERLSATFNVYIHIDMKTHVTKEQKEKFKQLNSIVISKYNVKWGSYSIVRATIDLIRLALANKNNTYFHLISGQDWPMMPPRKIYEHFEHTDRIYMNYWLATSMRKTGEPEIWWSKYYYNYDKVNRKSTFGKIYHRLLLLFQTIFRVNKLKKFGLKDDYIYAGQQWVDVPRDSLDYAIEYYDSHPEIEKIFSTSFCADEMWLQTILCNSKYKDRIEKNIHHFIDVVTINGSTNPSILDERYYLQIVNNNYWWGRKVIHPISDKLIAKLDKKYGYVTNRAFNKIEE